MSEPDGKAIVRRFFDEAWNQNSVAELARIMREGWRM